MNRYSLWKCDDGSYDVVEEGAGVAFGNLPKEVAQAFITHEELRVALRELVTRCDGEQGVRADGSNIDTLAAHAALGDLRDAEAAEAAMRG